MGKKLIEVAPFLPLDAISVASKADKDKKTGTIRNVHKWFAPMPTPALRALIFGAIVDAPDDPEEHDELLNLVERLVPPDGNAPSEQTLVEARETIRASVDGELPLVLDPFCGGGSTLIEAQRLGLSARGSDLNPVPALITRTLTQLVPAVVGRAPLASNPDQLGSTGHGHLDALLTDICHYAEIVRAEVWDRVGYLYPTGPAGETVIAWLWAWTAECPNPTCRSNMPLVSSMWLSRRKNASRWLEPRITPSGVVFDVKRSSGPPPKPAKVGRGAKFRCFVCGEVADDAHIKAFGCSNGLGHQLLTTVVDTERGREYLDDVPPPPTVARPDSAPDGELPDDPRAMWCKLYGLHTYADQFTNRQLVTLEAFATEIGRVPGRVTADGGDEDYAAAIASVLGLALGKLAQSNSTQVRWKIDSRNGSAKAEPGFSRHAMPLVWDFAEANPFGGSVGDWMGQVESITRGLSKLPSNAPPASVTREDARVAGAALSGPALIVTDPPYFDQIGYADLSDYFYVWHRKALRNVHPDLYTTIVTPKSEELIANPYRHDGDKEAAAQYFIDGFTETFKALKTSAAPDHPIIIVYAHRQEERSSLGTASTGWDAMLEAILAAGLTIEGTLPIRGTGSSRQISQGTNSLASYIVMVCRPASGSDRPGTIADFRAELRARLPGDADRLLDTGESMVDIRQAAIGPGMEVFSRFNTIFDGSEAISVRRALTIINEELGRIMDEHLGRVDDETRWACQWYADHGFEHGEYNDARKGAQTYGLGVDGIEQSGIIESSRGSVRLLRRAELPGNWQGDDRTPLWEALQHLVARLTVGANAGEESAGELLAALGPKAAGAKGLAQYLTNLAIEKGWSDEAIAYNALVKSWPRIEQRASTRSTRSETLL